jgi:two-component system CheB/CheR fusion protein
MKSATSISTKKFATKKKISSDTFPIVAIGASAGGLEAMTEFLKNLPSDTGMAFIYVQHLSPDHKSMLTQILSKSTKMKVQEIDDMDKIKPNNVFVIPPNKAIKIVDGHIKLIPRPANSSTISIDVLFTSLAQAQKERVIGIILSGSASDGAHGINDIKREGGLTFAQDTTAKFMSMPQSAIATGAVDFVLSPREIALELARISKHPFVKTNGEKTRKEDLIENSDPDLQNILRHLHKAVGVDFSAYKMNTIKRRIIRRMLLYKIKTLKEYAKLLNEKKEETDILYNDLLINVTSFFRDTDVYKYLETTLFPKMLENKKNGESLRIWVPACSTGEEVCSIAMLLIEIQEGKNTKIPIQIFATDISVQAISKARTGMFSKQDIETVSPKRIQRFFTKTDTGYRISKSVREMCVFAPHNILSNPPFSRLDFISCCNLFIYLDTSAQKKVIATFHYALNEGGYLMLGKSEAISSSTQFFTAENKKFKIFTRRKNAGVRTLPALSSSFTRNYVQRENLIPGEANKFSTNLKKSSLEDRSLENAINAVLISEFMPASVVINHNMEILQFRGSTDLYLTHAPGKATFNILKMARPEIAFELRTAVLNAIKTKHRIRKGEIEMKVNEHMRIISIEVVSLKIEWDEPLLLIVFTEQEHVEIVGQNTNRGKNNTAAKDRRIKKLEEELAAVQADALAFAQEQEAFTEELQSANEEVVSSNEELQTMNEELETSKEEIESVNEELRTTNEEMQTRNDLLNEAYEYSEAITATIHDPMLILDKNLRVKSANKAFYKTFEVKEAETEGMLVYDLGNGQWNIARLREFLEDIILKNTYIRDFEVSHNFPRIGEKIMLLNANRIIQKTHREQLILLVISDVTEQATAQKRIAESEKRFKELIKGLPIGIYTCNSEGEIELYNETAVKLWGRTPEPGKDKWCGSWKMYNADGALLPHGECPMAVAVKEGRIVNKEVIIERPDGTRYSVIPYPQPVYDSNGKIIGAVNTVIDITAQTDARNKIEESENRYRELSLSLEQKVEDRTEEINKANEKLREKNETLQHMNKELEAFTYVSSHDLQEPLRKIQILAGRIIEKDGQNLSDKGKDYFHRLRDAAERMQTLIYDLLAFSRLGSSERKFETTDINIIIEDVKKELKEAIAEKHATIEVKEMCKIKVIPFQFRQLMQNLIGNSLKFSNPGKPPYITIKSTKVKYSKINIENLPPLKEYCHISITDNGIGFEEEFYEKIFEVFQKLHSKDKYPGTGIGLAIVKKIVENHNGIITATSEVGKGTTFDIYIPA